METEALTVAEAAKCARLSRAGLYKLLRAGEGPRVAKLGRRTVVLRSSLRDWLCQCEAATAQPGVGRGAASTRDGRS